jgi:hypothetical protein
MQLFNLFRFTSTCSEKKPPVIVVVDAVVTVVVVDVVTAQNKSKILSESFSWKIFQRSTEMC